MNNNNMKVQSMGTNEEDEQQQQHEGTVNRPPQLES